jgi:hypothetical protein
MQELRSGPRGQQGGSQQGQIPMPSQPPLPPGKQHKPNPQHVQNQYLTVPGQVPQQGPKNQGMPLGGNNIALPTPNYTYSHIGPNNQSLLSTNTLNTKLKVIEKIN